MTTPSNDLFLGIDTSNYTSSVAIVDGRGKILADCRRMLEVPKAARGLRQQDAVFQHVKNLPGLIEESFRGIRGELRNVTASTRPRPQEGSYMPVFTVGEAIGRSVAASLNCPFNKTTHQDGHIYAIKEYSSLKDEKPFFFIHMSGGTTEVCEYDIQSGKIEILGGTKDISLGQVLDRVGVRLGLSFPAGAEMDKIALAYADNPCQKLDLLDKNWGEVFKKIKLDGMDFNLSGMESAIMRAIDNKADTAGIIYITFILLSDLIVDLIGRLQEKNKNRQILLAGGVSQSKFLQKFMKEKLKEPTQTLLIQGKYGSDNAIGPALIGRERYYKVD